MTRSDAINGTVPYRNRLLSSLAPEAIEQLRPHLARVPLVAGQILHERGEAVRDVYFFERGLASVVASTEEEHEQTAGSGVEIGLMGSEGLVGWWVLLDPAAIAPQRVLVQIAGQAWRMSEADLRAASERHPALRNLLLRYAQAVSIQVAQTAACNARHGLTERLARWLLMSLDRTVGDELPLTQEFLGLMLGVRRSGVTVAAGTLQQAGLIRYSRGQIKVLDRAGLESSSCQCYRMVREHFDRLLGPTSEQTRSSMYESAHMNVSV